MALSPFATNHKTSGVRADYTTDTYDLQTRGRTGIVVAVNVTAIGNGHAVVAGGTTTDPLVVTGLNDTFKVGTDDYAITHGTYSNLASIAAAVNAATKAGPTAFSALATASVSSPGLTFTHVATGVYAAALHPGTNDALADLGFTDGQTFGHAGADGTASLTVSILGVLPITGLPYTILSSAAITAIGTTVLQVHPGMTAAANLVANSQLPSAITISIAHTTNNAVTYSVESFLTP